MTDLPEAVVEAVLLKRIVSSKQLVSDDLRAKWAVETREIIEAYLAAAPAERMPTMDEAYRFIASNPVTSAAILVETQKIASDDAPTSNGRIRDLWRLAGGMVDKRGRAWIEFDLLPGIIRTMAELHAQSRIAALEAERDRMRDTIGAVLGEIPAAEHRLPIAWDRAQTWADVLRAALSHPQAAEETKA